jgi:predicted CXXCH cytochrome family protein
MGRRQILARIAEPMKLIGTSAMFLVLSGVLGAHLCYAGVHPVRVDEHSNCVECHADHAAGQYIHPALKNGCISCHKVENHDDGSYVAMQPRESNGCRACHASAPVLHPHFPYASGMCTRCHNPHASRVRGLLRTKVNDLCLDCHLQSRAKQASRYLPTIELTSDNRMGHPYARHPVSGLPDPISGVEMSCISCHQPHGGNKLHQLKMGSEIPEDALNQNTETKDMCEKCHMKLWGMEGAGAKKGKKKIKAVTITH